MVYHVNRLLEMPKVKSSDAVHLRKFIVEFGEDVFLTNGLALLCKFYGVKIPSEKNFL